MLSKTNYTVDVSIFQEACNQLPHRDMKTTINQPTGNFFYDEWELKEEFKVEVDTVVFEEVKKQMTVK